MHLVSIQVGGSQTRRIGQRSVQTGIDKRSVASAEITFQGVTGDGVVDVEHHGGPDQALYLYSAVDHLWWREVLGREVRAGEFGENLTLSSLGDSPPRVGDRYRIGPEVTIELTAPRIPCAVLGAQMGDTGFPERLRSSRRPGAYARVLTPGLVTEGDPVERTEGPAGAPSIGELFDLYYDRDASPHDLERALRAPLASRARALYEERLARFG